MSNTARRAPTIRARSATSIPRASESTSSVNQGATRAARVKDSDSNVTGATAAGATRPGQAGAIATRKRAALGDLTNANRSRTTTTTTSSRIGNAASNGVGARTKSNATAAEGSTKVPRAESSAAAGKRLASTVRNTEEESSKVPRGAVRRTVPANGHSTTARPPSTASTTVSSSAATRSTATRGVPARRPAQRTTQTAPDNDATTVQRETKRVKVETDGSNTAVTSAAPSRATVKDGTSQDADTKAQEWEDLDAEDADDPLMVAEYVNEIFAYMKEIESTTVPNGNYMDTQNEIDWYFRGVLVDWLIDTHSKFRMLPETLFLALNIVDRFLTVRTITLNKLQLVGLTAMFIAAKYEEVLCPSVANFLYLADGGYTADEILRAERYMLKVLGFNLSYASPMTFLRRISKADNYDIQTRTVAKFFMEISLVDYRLIEHPPSLVAAAGVWMARKVLERGPWTPTLVHYSSYTEYELLGTAEIMLDFVLRPVQHNCFFKKYASKKFMRASTYVVEWAKTNYPDAVWPESEVEYQVLTELRVDLFSEQGLVRPRGPSDYGSPSTEDRSASPAVKEANSDWNSSIGTMERYTREAEIEAGTESLA